FSNLPREVTLVGWAFDSSQLSLWSVLADAPAGAVHRAQCRPRAHAGPARRISAGPVDASTLWMRAPRPADLNTCRRAQGARAPPLGARSPRYEQSGRQLRAARRTRASLSPSGFGRPPPASAEAFPGNPFLLVAP